MKRDAYLNSDDTLLANLVHGTGEKVTNVLVAVGGNGGDLGNLGRSGNDLGVLLQVLDNRVHGRLNTSPEVGRVHASGNGLEPLDEDGTRQNSGSGSTVTSSLVGLVRNILNEAGSEVLKLVLELNGLIGVQKCKINRKSSKRESKDTAILIKMKQDAATGRYENEETN
jgi:hypothetical protein